MQNHYPLHRLYSIGSLLLCLFVLIALASARAEAAAAKEPEDLVPLQVAAGTNLIELAKEYCHKPDSWQTIAQINKLEPPYIIYAYREIDVPLSLLKIETLSLEVVTVSGEAVLEKKNGETAGLSQGERMAPGDTLMTGEETFVQLLFPNGVYTRVDPNSALTLSYLFSLKDGKIKAEALLAKGKLTHTLNKKLRFNDSMRTRTPVVITGIRGTEYRLKAEEAQATTVETLEGEVTVQAGAKSVRLQADQGIRAQSGQALGSAQALPLPPPVPRLESVYRTLPLQIQLPVQAGIRDVKLRLSTDEAGQATVYEHTAQAGAPLKVQELPDGRYYAFFTVTDKKGFESREQGPRPVIIRTMPPAPMVIAPRKGSIQWGAITQVNWLESEQAVRYRAQIARDVGFTDIVDDRELKHPTFSSPELNPGTYYFRVQALASDGFTSNFSDPLNWEQREAPTMGGLESTSDEPPVLQWPPMGEDWRYDIQIARDKEFTELLVDQQNLATTSYTFADKLDPGKYYIHLRGFEQGEPATPWTPTQTMTVKNRPKVLEGSLIGALLLGVVLLL